MKYLEVKRPVTTGEARDFHLQGRVSNILGDDTAEAVGTIISGSGNVAIAKFWLPEISVRTLDA